ncbi:Outer membrane protein TolC [Desulfurobacterium pacificum]|uniref:Outer membrane protein TolC n=1 Tax=Desulfurobacterium pacificum TaxID=240166 RepID=A0ABY1NAG2_9BACT|nr:TolC family protein [Desulfurobacterium pacificum]SMP04775.1 Outer membrane protein TolC [Desulfurobacterium pacificum]
MKRLMPILILVALTKSVYSATLGEVIDLALKNNPEIKKAKEETKITLAQYKEAISKFFPDVKLEYFKTHLSDVPSYSMSIPGLPPMNFSLFEKNFYMFKVSATQPIFMGGKLILNKEIKKKIHTASFYQFEEVTNRIVCQVKKDFYTAVEAKNAVLIAKEYLKAAESHYKTVKAFYDEGIVARRDLLEAEVNLKEAEESLEKAKNAYKVAIEKLKEDTGYTLKDENVPIKTDFVKVKESLKELIKLALKNRPILKALKLEKKAADEGVKMSYASFSPDVFLNLTYEKTDQYPMNGNFDNVQVSLGVSLPLFEGGYRFFRVEEAKGMRRKVDYEYEKAVNAVKLQVTAAYSKLKTAQKRIETAKAMVREAEELLKDSKERYKEHVGTSTEVVDAIAYLTKAKGILNSAVADYSRAVADLEYAIGKRIER